MRHPGSVVAAPVAGPLKDLTRDLVDPRDALRQHRVRVNALKEQVASAEPVKAHLRRAASEASMC